MIAYRLDGTLVGCARVWPLIEAIDVYYPDLAHWFWNKVAPGVVSGQDRLLLAEDGDEAVGVVILKRGDEPKLRCVRVLPRLKSRGVGIHLIDRALKALDCDKPLITVPEETIHDYSRILVNRFDFALSVVEKGLYRPGKLEYVFNGGGDLRRVTPLGSC